MSFAEVAVHVAARPLRWLRRPAISHASALSNARTTIDDGGLAVAAHVLLNSVSALHGSLTLARRADTSEAEREQLLDVAHRHSTALASLLRDVIAGDHAALTAHLDLGDMAVARRPDC